MLKIVKNVAMTNNTIIHVKIIMIHFILNFLLTKHYKTSSFCISSMFLTANDYFYW